MVQKNCSIATAAYGRYLTDEAVVLRDFRDRYLLTNSVGRTLVKIYCRFSPPLAEYIAHHESPKKATRITLTQLVYTVKYPLIALLLFLQSGILVVRRWAYRKVKR